MQPIRESHQLSRLTRRGLLIGLAAVILACIGARDAAASVMLKYFRAAPQADGAILVEWATVSELDVVAFRLWRSESISSLGQIVGTQPAIGDSVIGATYAYLDPAAQLVPGQEYAYRLEALTAQGASTWYGPVAMRAGTSGWRVYLPLALRGG